mmetsp:Transcript_2832/g.8529  ORF Transcript_2832/g.8529 Transcript_2832/m.8529 type:complete len:225 (+) Transcript_2832:259-933(+)
MTVSRSAWSRRSSSPLSSIATTAAKGPSRRSTVPFLLWYAASSRRTTLTTTPARSQEDSFARSCFVVMSRSIIFLVWSSLGFFVGVFFWSSPELAKGRKLGRRRVVRKLSSRRAAGSRETATFDVSRRAPGEESASSRGVALTLFLSSLAARSSSSASCLRFFAAAACRASAAGSLSIHCTYQPFSVSSTTQWPCLPRYWTNVVSVVQRVAFMCTCCLSLMYSL